MTQQPPPRFHVWLAKDEKLCGVDTGREPFRPDPDEAAELPFCGSCMLAFEMLSRQVDRIMDPDGRRIEPEPQPSLVLLRSGKWADHYHTVSIPADSSWSD